MNPSHKAAITPSDREITITRVFDAPRELVFAAWTDPRHVERWWGPKGYTSFACEIDLRVGGAFGLQMRGPDGAVYPCRGVFRDVVEPEKIVYAAVLEEGHPCGAGLPPRAIVTITFAEHDRKTTLTIHTRLESAADHDAAVNAGFVPGWESSLQRLAEVLAAA
jgi:uncharacterized protein YndB with AHSA1/START domain